MIENTLLNDSHVIGIVFEIERYAIHDGPGIRTLVFLKGCPLECLWCANPESQQKQPQLVYSENKCLGCRKCIETCSENALTVGIHGIVINYTKCRSCGRCVSVCNAEALVLLGRKMEANEVLKEILKDENFYRNSGGGVTFSGGEPFAQIDFLMALVRLCKKNFIHTCIETCGNVSWAIMSRILPYVDIFLYDFKAMNPEKHQKYTGVSNKLILNNFKKLVILGKEVIARIPIIPGLNDDEENYRILIQFLSKNAPGVHINLLPYHRLGLSKYHLINKTYTLNNLKPPTAKKVKEIKKMLTNSGFDVSIGG